MNSFFSFQLLNNITFISSSFKGMGMFLYILLSFPNIGYQRDVMFGKLEMLGKYLNTLNIPNYDCNPF